MTKVYVAGIYEMYEGGCAASGVFTTREAAEQSCKWFTDNAKYFENHHDFVFHVDEFELNDTSQFTNLLEARKDYIKYLAEDDTFNQYATEDERELHTKVLESLNATL